MNKTSKTIASALLSLALLTQPFAGLPLTEGLAVARAESGAGEAVTVFQAKEHAPSGSGFSRIAGIVWSDANENGSMDDDETIVAGVELTLLARSADIDAMEGPTATRMSTPRPAPASASDDQGVYYSDTIDPSDILTRVDGEQPPSDEYVPFLSATSDAYGWYSFDHIAPCEYVLMANLDDGQSLTVMRDGQSVFDPETWRTVPFTVSSEDTQLDDMHLGMANDVQKETDGLVPSSGTSTAPLTAQSVIQGPVAQSQMIVSMIADSFLTEAEYSDLYTRQPETFEYVRSLFGADADLTQVTLEQAELITSFNPADAGVTDMQGGEYLARMSTLTNINLSNQPLSDGLVISDDGFQKVVTLNLSGCGGDIRIGADTLPNLTALNVDGAHSITFETDALKKYTVNPLVIQDVGELNFGAGALPKITTLTVKGTIGDLSIAAGSLPNMSMLDMSGASISNLRMEDGTSEYSSVTSACYSLNVNGGIKFGTIDSWYFGSYAMPRFSAINLASLAATSVEFGDHALPICTTLTLSNAALETVRFGDNACNAVTRLVFNNTTGKASLKSLSIGANSLQGLSNNGDNTNGLNLSNNVALDSIALGSGSLNNLSRLTLNNTGLKDLSFLGKDAMPTLTVLNAQNIPATAITVPGDTLKDMTTLSFANSPNLQKLTFADDSAPDMILLTLTGIGTLTEMVIGDRAMKSYANFNLTLSPPKVHTLTIGNDSLNKATTFNPGAYLENLTVGENSLNACTSIGNINIAGSPLKSLTVGTGSFAALGYSILNLSQCAKLTSENVSIAVGAFPNVKTLTLDGSGLVDLDFLLKGALSTVTVLNWKTMGVSSLRAAENVLPNLLTLDVSNNVQLTDLSIGAGSMPLANKLTLTNCPNLSQITCGNGAMGALTVLSAQALSSLGLTISGEGFAAVTNLNVSNSTALTTITVGQNALPKLSTFTTTGAPNVNTLVIGEGALAAATTLTLSSLPALTSLEIGSGALASLTTLTLTGTGLTSLTIDEGALPELLTLTLGSGLVNSSKLTSLTVGENALNKLATLTFATYVGAPLQTFTVGANALGNVKTLTLTNNALSSFTAGEDSLGALTTLTITNTQMMDMNFLADGGMKNLKSLYMRNLPATELTVPTGSLQKCTQLDMVDNAALASLTFEDNTCPLVPGGGFQLYRCNNLATLIVGDNVMTSYDCWHPAEGQLPVKTMIIGNNSLTAAKRFGFSDVMETVRVGNNSFPNITTLTFQTGVGNGIKVIPPLRSMIIGENSFRGTANLMNLSNYTDLTELVIGNGSFTNVATLTLTGSGLTALDINKDMLPGLKTLTLGSNLENSATLESLTIGADALPNLTALNFCSNALSGSALKSLVVGDGALKSLTTLAIPYSKNIETLQFGANALSTLTTFDLNSSTAGLVSFGQGSAPKLTNFKLNNADIDKLYFGKDTLATYVGSASAPLLAGAAGLKQFEAEEGALKALTSLATLPGNQLTSFITRGNALEKVPVLNMGTQPSLTKLEANLLGMTALKELYLGGTAIANLDFADGSLQNTTQLSLPFATLNTLRFGANTLPKYTVPTLLLNNAPLLTSLSFAANSLPLITSIDGSANPLLTTFAVESGALSGLSNLTLTDCSALENLSDGIGLLPKLATLDISHSGMRSLDISAGKFAQLSQLRADNMDAFTADEGGVFTIQNGELPNLQSLFIKGQKAMSKLDVQAGTAGNPTLPNLVDLAVAPINGIHKAGYEATSLSEIGFHAYTMPKVETIELNNTQIRKIELDANAMPGLKMFYPADGTVFTEIMTGANAAPNLYRFQRDNSQLVSLAIGDGSGLNLGNAIPASLSALAGGDYDPLNGLNKNIFQSLKLGAGTRPGQHLANLDLTGFAALHTFELADGLTMPDLEKMIITGTQLASFPSLDNVSLPKLTQLHLFENPLSGAFTQSNLPTSLVELRMNHTDIDSMDLSGSTMPNLETLVADHSPNLEEVTINTPGSFGRQKMDLFRFSNSRNLARMELDAETIANLMDGMSGDNHGVIDLHNTRLGYADLLPLVHPQSASSNVTITLPEDFMDALANGEVPANTTQGAQVAMLYSGAAYNSGSGDAPLASSVLVDNLYPVYRIHPDIYYAGMINSQQGPNNSMAGTFEADQTEGGLIAYLDSLPESQAQGLRALLASGFPNKTLGLSANDAACVTAEAIAAFLNENLPDGSRVASNFNYAYGDQPPVDGLSYAQAPDPVTNPEGYALYTAVMDLLDAARFASTIPVDHTPPSLAGDFDGTLNTPDPANPNVITAIVRVTQKNINGRYIIADHSSNITQIEKQTATGWEVIPAPLSYQGNATDVLQLTIDNTDKTAAITLDLKAVNIVGLGEYYDVTSTDNGDFQNDQYKSDYIAVRGTQTTAYDTSMLLRPAEAIVTISYKWKGQDSAIQPLDTVHFVGAKPGDKVYIGGADGFTVSAPAINGFVSPEADCGDFLTITGENDRITFYYKKPITISGATGTKVYNGQAQTLTGIVADLSGDTLTGLTALGTGEDVGTYPVVVSGTPKLASGKTFSELYVPTITNGKFTISAASLSIAAPSGNYNYDATAHTLTGYQIVSGQLWDNDQLTVSLAGNTRTDAGDSETSIQSYSITSGGHNVQANYTVKFDTKGKLSVKARPLTVTPETKSFTYNGTDHTLSYTQSGLLPGHTAQVTLTGSTRKLVGNNAVTVASVQVLNGSDVSANYTLIPGTGSITVNPAVITVKAGSESFLFTGAPQSMSSYQVSGDLASTDTVSHVELLNNVRTDVGFNAVNVGTVQVMSGTTDVSNCYAITPVAGKITIAMDGTEVIITAKDVTARYDGQNHWGTEYTVAGLKAGEKVQSVRISGEGVDVGSYPLTPSNAVIVDAQNKVIKSYAKISYVPGALSITTRPATITVDSQSFPYDGREHTVGVKATGLLDGHEAVANLIGATRKDPNRYDVTFDAAKPTTIMEGTKNVTKNYTLTLTAGTITILPKGSIVHITARDVAATYDGTKHGHGGYDISGLLDGDRVEGVVISGESVNAGTFALVPSGAKILDANNRDVTAGYQKIEYTSGKLTVGKRALSVSVDSKSFPYDGQPHRVDCTVSGDLLSGDTVSSVILTGNGRTQVGFNNVSVGKVAVMRGNADVSGNYTATKTDGVIQITPRNDLTYRIEYYYAGVLDSAATVTQSGQMLGATVSSYPDKPKADFAFSRVQYGSNHSASALVVGLIDESNVIRVYYENTSGMGYTVEYHYQNAKGDGYDLGTTDTVGGMKVGDVITEVNQRIMTATLPGFTFERSEGLALTLAADKTQNVIRVYYQRAQNIAYSVEYYYNGDQDTAATERYSGHRFGEVIHKYTDKCAPGYELQSVETLPFTLTMHNELNVIRVYYDLISGGELPQTIVDASIPLSAGVGSLNVGDCIE